MKSFLPPTRRFPLAALSLAIAFLSPSLLEGQDKKKGPQPNLADPEVHPYADPQGGRDRYLLSKERVNEARLYDFYQRQADYYLSSSRELPDILPAYPGLDAGLHGHWGKHNQNNHKDARWNDAEMGEMITQVFRAKDLTVLKGICLRLGEQRELSACFDPETLSYRVLWENGFVSFDGFRWGTSRNAALKGDPWFLQKEASMPRDGSYLGFHRFGRRVVFRYRIGEVEIEDEPWATSNAFYRRIDLKSASASLRLDLPAPDGLEGTILRADGLESARIDPDSGALLLEKANPGARVILRFARGSDIARESDQAALVHLESPREAERRWKQDFPLPVTRGEPGEGAAYAVDTFAIPHDNPWNVVMQLSGIAFRENGDALVCTLLGDIWRVAGIADGDDQVTWSRFATGLNQPIGIHVDEEGIFVLDRGQIYRLHDTNEDGEADFYENYANDFGGYDRSHTHTFGLHRTADGAFHFTQRESILRTGPDRQTTLQGWGVRNCMGIGGSDNYFWVAPQEGTWTPASAIIEVNEGEFYGLPTKDGKGGTIAAPLCFLPRGVDNSTGGMVEITSSQWGPFEGSHVGLSYGSGIHYLILRDDRGDRPQGAVVPLEGEFRSGSMRGAFHPEDGQLYLVGLDGWGDYSIEDGCFHRVRYTGGPVLKPSGFQVHQNGIRIDFPMALDSKTAADPGRFFAQCWNYEFAKRYGSPEFSYRDPESLGHDPLEVRSVVLLDENRSLFVELPDMEPVMQLQIRMHLQSADGASFRTDLFASPMFPGDYFTGEGLAPPRGDKPTAIALRVAAPKEQNQNQPTESGEAVEGERLVTVDAIGGLQYAQKLIEARPGEALAWKLRNTDVMPHNLVLVQPDAARKVGEASFKMLSDPEAGEKHYVPGLDEVIAFIPIIDPGQEHTLHLRAPTTPGDYPYLCTFPGHWMAMQGILRVR